MKKVAAFLIGLFFVALASKPSFASPPANFQRNLIIGTGLTAPTGFAIAPDGRIFITEREGAVRIAKNGQLLSTPFTTLPSAATGDRGLAGVAFDPDFLTNHFVYFYYTDAIDLHNKLVRFDASQDIAQEGGLVLYQTNDQSFSLHIGGTVQFGPDGKIYISIGDNGFFPNAQDITNSHGKIIRLNKDGTIPTDNPFYTIPGAAKEIWAMGFRNPFRFQFDSITGNMYEGDVGEASWEEINKIEKGNNYGWPQCEGFCIPSNPLFTDPIFAWPHDPQIAAGSAAAVGGPVYHGDMFPADFQGRLFFGDYAQGWIKTMKLDANGNNSGVEDFDPNVGTVVDMHVDPKDGSLYYLDIFPSALYQITFSTGNHAPVANASADALSGPNPLTVHFSSAGTSDPDNDSLTYFWDFGDGSQSTEINPTHTFTNPGTYTVQMKVSDGQFTSLAVPLVVNVGIPPTVDIISPLDKSTYHAGDTIHYQITAQDSHLNDLSGNQVATTVLFHHQSHIHPFLGPINGVSGDFTIPTTGESSPDVWFEIDVTATDGSGLSTTKAINIFPVESNLTYTSSPEGLQILLDGLPTTTPLITKGVVGFQRTLSVPVYQQKNGTYYTFHNWSDGGEVIHVVTTPPQDATFSAQFDTAAPFHAEYFKNSTLSGSPDLTRDDPAINFTYGDTGSPDPSFDHNQFSARWTAQQFFAKGRYTFKATVDDGVRLFIDGNVVIDKWMDEPTTTYTATVDLSEGIHEITMEYYQAFGGANAQLTWDLAPEATTITPTPTGSGSPTPTPTPIVVQPTPTPIVILGTPTPTVSSTPSGEPTPSLQPSPSATPSAKPTLSITPTPSLIMPPPIQSVPTPTSQPSATITPSSYPTPTDTPAPTVSYPTPTAIPTMTDNANSTTNTSQNSSSDNSTQTNSSSQSTPDLLADLLSPTPMQDVTGLYTDFLTTVSPSPTLQPSPYSKPHVKAVKGVSQKFSLWNVLMGRFEQVRNRGLGLWKQILHTLTFWWSNLFR